ncbi:MAG: phenylalanine--tRNA ligase subunit beta [Bacteroidetes bacterium HGW-Bacteroidetes-11]|nr:MAG: phenylalanine--tRNA ligase subunit beta [Bacteroidetes bacterium HGW-Bacteroidetes-11]
MKISYNWLKEYLDTRLSVEELSLVLTDIGLEVEAIESFESLKGGLKGVVTGEVKSCERHPNADKLSITTVDVGAPELLHIVCGAPNVAAGQKVVVATIGTMIYKGDESFEIKKSKIRGELSEGMICAEDELGIGNSHDGILVLPEDVPIGLPAAGYFGITNDIVFEIGLTPNRADAASHIGVARDLAAAITARGLEEKPVRVRMPDVSTFKTDNNNFHVDVTVEDTEACPRYSGITVSGIKVGPSPSRLADRLKAIGVRPINNVVDITNYVLFEYGQPLHAFNASVVSGKSVVVKKMAEGTPFVTLDEVERKLGAGDLMICNAEEPMCIAGVFGGTKSGVNESTTAVFLESAYFNPVSVRKTSKLHSLKTDASFRFERGTDPEITVVALKRAAMLIKEICGGEISSDVIDVYPNPVEHKRISLSYAYVNRFVGQDIPSDDIKVILNGLGIGIVEETIDGLTLDIPPFKVDVTGIADVIEEILRIYGYNKIDAGDKLNSSISYHQRPDREKLQNLIADYLSSNGFNEILTNSLSSSAYYEGGTWFDPEKNVKILNPLSRELDTMRQTLLFSGLESVAYNLNRRQLSLKFYEFGFVYELTGAQVKGSVEKSYREQKLLALYLTGQSAPESWHNDDSKTDFYQLRSFVASALRKTGIDQQKLQRSESIPPFFASGELHTMNGKAIYCIGRLQDKLLKQFGISQPVFYAGIHWDNLVQAIRNHTVTYQEVSKFPEVRRDLALVLDKSVKYADLEAIAFRAGKQLLKKVNLFDIYEGDKIEAGKKSYAISFILQDENKTLTDKEIDKFMDRMADVLEKEAAAKVRR